MAATTLSLQQFHENVRAAEEAAKNGPVLIEDSSGPHSVLLNFDDYLSLQRRAISLAEAFSVSFLTDDAADFEFQPSELMLHSVDLT